MLCKEQGITICGICAVYEIFVVQKVKKRAIFIDSWWRIVLRMRKLKKSAKK